ncbi:MAG: hypothetical protein H7321_09310 [Bacteroidia bacterium]|nr:hypothetical protein [Bacteroidia bacterium]
MTRKEELQVVTADIKRKLQQEVNNIAQGAYPMPGLPTTDPEALVVLFDAEAGLRITALITELGVYQTEYEKIPVKK